MPEFHGPKNLHIGASADKDGNLVPAWAESVYDADSRSYVITLSAADAKKFRALGDEHKHGFSEVKSSSDDAPPDAE